jgi:hypothetical protein
MNLEWSRRETCDIDGRPEGASDREIVSQSRKSLGVSFPKFLVSWLPDFVPTLMRRDRRNGIDHRARFAAVLLVECGRADTLHGKILVFSGREGRQRNYRLAALRSSARRHDCAHKTVAVAGGYRCSQHEVAQLQLSGNGVGDMWQGFRGGVRLRIDLQKIFIFGIRQQRQISFLEFRLPASGHNNGKERSLFRIGNLLRIDCSRRGEKQNDEKCGPSRKWSDHICRSCSAVAAICFTMNSVSAVSIFDSKYRTAVVAALCRRAAWDKGAPTERGGYRAVLRMRVEH